MSIKILLCCGAGMSSGFLATSTTKAAITRGLDYEVTAKSYSVALEVLADYNLCFLGPHYSAHLEEFQEIVEEIGCDTKVAVIPKDIYGNVDGDALVEMAESILES